MKIIKFSEEIMCISGNFTFWIEIRGEEYSSRYVVHLSKLEQQNFCGEPSENLILRSECFKNHEDAKNRLDEILSILMKIHN